MAGLVPGLDDRVLAIPAEDRERAGREAEQAAERRLQADPARGEDAEQVTVREEQDVAVGRRGPGRGRGPPVARPRPRSRRRARARSRWTSPGTSRGCPASASLRGRRSPTRRDPARPSRRRSRPGGRLARPDPRAREDQGERRPAFGRAGPEPGAERDAPARARRRSAGCRSGRCAGRAGPTRSGRGGRARSWVVRRRRRRSCGRQLDVRADGVRPARLRRTRAVPSGRARPGRSRAPSRSSCCSDRPGRCRARGGPR